MHSVENGYKFTSRPVPGKTIVENNFLELFMRQQQELGDCRKNAYGKFRMEMLAGCVTDAEMT